VTNPSDFDEFLCLDYVRASDAIRFYHADLGDDPKKETAGSINWINETKGRKR